MIPVLVGGIVAVVVLVGPVVLPRLSAALRSRRTRDDREAAPSWSSPAAPVAPSAPPAVARRPLLQRVAVERPVTDPPAAQDAIPIATAREALLAGDEQRDQRPAVPVMAERNGHDQPLVPVGPGRPERTGVRHGAPARAARPAHVETQPEPDPVSRLDRLLGRRPPPTDPEAPQWPEHDMSTRIDSWRTSESEGCFFCTGGAKPSASFCARCGRPIR